MKVGSLCEYVGNLPSFEAYGCFFSPPPKRVPLTVREVYLSEDSPDKGKGIYLIYVEEHCCGKWPNGTEVGINSKHFRELLPPEEIAEALEEVNEVLKEQEALV